MKISQLDTSGYRPESGLPALRITYCKPCGYLARATWTAQELLADFSDELDSVSLQPGSKGVFDVVVGDDVLWSKHAAGGFPDIDELKNALRALLDSRT